MTIVSYCMTYTYYINRIDEGVFKCVALLLRLMSIEVLGQFKHRHAGHADALSYWE